jgi:hypothetical protein
VLHACMLPTSECSATAQFSLQVVARHRCAQHCCFRRTGIYVYYYHFVAISLWQCHRDRRDGPSQCPWFKFMFKLMPVTVAWGLNFTLNSESPIQFKFKCQPECQCHCDTRAVKVPVIRCGTCMTAGARVARATPSQDRAAGESSQAGLI